MKNILLVFALLCGVQSLSFAQSQNDKMEKTTEQTSVKLKIKGATCKTDLGLIVANIEKMEGVSKCEVLKHGAVTTVEVFYDSAITDTEKLQAAVMNTGTCENPDERRYSVKI